MNQPSTPSTNVQSTHTITVDLERLKANPKIVRQERASNTFAVGLLGAATGGVFGGCTDLIKGTSRTMVTTAITAGAIIGGIIGAYQGKRSKTSEEDLSEKLIAAAKSGHFEEALKQEMRRRDEEAAAAMASAGSTMNTGGGRGY